MAEIYTYSANTSQGHMSPDTSDHINSVLADLGLGGASADSADVSRSGAEPVGTTTRETPNTGGHIAAPATDGSADPSHAILAAPAPEPAPNHAPAAEPAIASPGALPESPAATPSHTAAPAGADSLPGAHAPSGPDAFGGLGTDTLWGSDGGTHALATLPPTPAGGDTIRSSGGMDTIYGGNATIYASGHSATLNTDTVHAGSEGATMDGSASAQTVHTDGSHAFADLPGGSGSDTIVLHDPSGSPMPVHDDAHGASAYPGYDGAGAHDAAYYDAAYYDTVSHDSVVGSDGSDHFAQYGYTDGHDAGTTNDGTGAHHDPYLSDGHVTHSDHGTYVSYHDGYDAGYSDPDQLQFKDTVMAG